MRKTLKNLIYQVHLWSGLITGVFIFLICLSGTILTFEKEIHSFSNPGETTSIDPLLTKKTIEELSVPLAEYGNISRITVQGETLPYIFNIQTSKEDRRGKNFFINPTNGEILNDPFQKPGWMMFFFRLHRWLLGGPDSFGKIVVGASTIVFGLLLISGFYLWWPRSKRQLKTVLTINLKNSKRMIYDLHNTLGFYSLIPLTIMTLTGLCWSFEWYRSGLSTILNAQVFGDRRIEAMEVTPRETKLDIETLIATINERLPYEGSVSIQINRNPKESYVARKTPDSGLKFTDIVQIDPYDKTIISEKLFSERSFGDKIASLIRHLHTGEFYGLFSKIIYFITCFIATTLPITGTIMWLNKLKKKKKAL
ncbi:MAG TPA: PepSY-associated TM helix domain-containing protein [Bacteriovoracaceae bacterium]|nr:PepSY-associated TM helix domain-containing protein [Bacteriovoracaceae bacterium]